MFWKIGRLEDWKAEFCRVYVFWRLKEFDNLRASLDNHEIGMTAPSGIPLWFKGNSIV